MRLVLAACVLAALATPARAGVGVSLQLTPDGQALAQRLGLTTSALEQQLAARVDALFATEHVPAFLQAFADAASFSARGLGVDYVPLDRGAVVGVSGTGAVAASDELTGPDRLTRGMAANVGIMAGTSLAPWGHPRVTVFANGFYNAAGTADLDGSLATGGAHVQVQVIAPQQRDAWLRWTGVAVTTGLEVTRWTLGTSHPVAQDLTVTGRGQAADVAFASSGRFDVSATTASVPVEVSTGMRLARVLGIYVGGGLDLSGGDGTLTAAQHGTLQDASGRMLGTVAIAGAASHDASPLEPRALAGAELELGAFRVFAQVNAAPSLASVGLGLRFSP